MSTCRAAMGCWWLLIDLAGSTMDGRELWAVVCSLEGYEYEM